MSATRAILIAAILLIVGIGGSKLLFSDVGLKDLATVIGLLIGVAGFVRSGSAPAASARALRRQQTPGLRARSRFGVALNAGFFGGFAGGIIGGVAIAASYLYDNPDEAQPLQIFAEIVVASAATGAVLGTSCQLFIAALAHRRRTSGGTRYLDEIVGGLMGGLLTGALVGPLIGSYFGSQSRSYIELDVMVPGAVLGGVCIVLSIAIFDRAAWSLTLLRNLLLAVLIGGIVGGLVVTAAFASPLSDYLADLFAFIPSTSDLMFGGLIYGLLVGFVLGNVIGLTLFFDKVWDPALRAA